MGMPMTPNMSQTAKQTMNAQVVTPRTIKLRAPDMRSPSLSALGEARGLVQATGFCKRSVQNLDDIMRARRALLEAAASAFQHF
ncbi:MAG: hypothetical protein C3F11_19795 [Methylocystaceae bacterium]|nr:MAG: hypothetical protein C3F11_19795 [Methylocystaceae bacterium]